MGANDMADNPIHEREFTLAMGSLREILVRLEQSQLVNLERLEHMQIAFTADIKQLQELHRNCMYSQSEKSFKSGQTTEKIEAIDNRVKDLETLQRTNLGHKRQLGIGVILTAMAAMLSLFVALWTRK